MSGCGQQLTLNPISEGFIVNLSYHESSQESRDPLCSHSGAHLNVNAWTEHRYILIRCNVEFRLE